MVDFYRGDGTASNPYAIKTYTRSGTTVTALEQLMMLGDALYVGGGHHFKLYEDIDLSTGTWSQIGSSSTKFVGNLNGNGYSIKNISITTYDTHFIYCDSSNIKNIHFDTFTVSVDYANTSKNHAIYAVDSTISRCLFSNVTIDVQSDGSYASPIRIEPNTNESYISNCYSLGSTISSKGSKHNNSVGDASGLVRSSKLVNIINCYSKFDSIVATHGSTSNSASGGICSCANTTLNGVTISDCVSLTPTITSESATYGKGDIGRKIYSVYGTPANLSNNYALDGGTDATSKDGLAVTSDLYSQQAFWDGTGVSGTVYLSWDFDDVWEWDSATNLPKLRTTHDALNDVYKYNGTSWEKIGIME